MAAAAAMMMMMMMMMMATRRMTAATSLRLPRRTPTVHGASARARHGVLVATLKVLYGLDGRTSTTRPRNIRTEPGATGPRAAAAALLLPGGDGSRAAAAISRARTSPVTLFRRGRGDHDIRRRRSRRR